MPAKPLDPLEVLTLICDHEHWKLLLHAEEIAGFGGTTKSERRLVLTSLDVLNEQRDLIACAAVGSVDHLQHAAEECVLALRALIDERAA